MFFLLAKKIPDVGSYATDVDTITASRPSGGGTHVGRGGYALWSDSSGAHVNQDTVPAHSQYDRYNETRNLALAIQYLLEV